MLASAWQLTLSPPSPTELLWYEGRKTQLAWNSCLSHTKIRPTSEQKEKAHDCTDEQRRVEVAVGCTRHQVVQPELLLPLETFRESKHLTSVVYDVAKGAFHHIIRPFLGVYDRQKV